MPGGRRRVRTWPAARPRPLRCSLRLLPGSGLRLLRRRRSTSSSAVTFTVVARATVLRGAVDARMAPPRTNDAEPAFNCDRGLGSVLVRSWKGGVQCTPALPTGYVPRPLSPSSCATTAMRVTHLSADRTHGGRWAACRNTQPPRLPSSGAPHAAPQPRSGAGSRWGSICPRAVPLYSWWRTRVVGVVTI
jgi:hypothetical protein